MDIVSDPTTPDGNPEMADAAIEPKEPPLIRREDYRPFAWLVPEIALDFDLGLERTRILSRLQVERNPAADRSGTIRLNGDGLAAMTTPRCCPPTATGLPRFRSKSTGRR